MKIENGVSLETYIEINQKTVEVRAYYYWENAGRPEGRSNEFYFQAMNDLFREAKEAILALKEQQDKSDIFPWAIETVESDPLWFASIEEIMPEIRTKKFKNVSQQISWMFNNLKKLKPVEKEENVMLTPVTDSKVTDIIQEAPPLMSTTLASEIIQDHSEAVMLPIVDILPEETIVHINSSIPQEIPVMLEPVMEQIVYENMPTKLVLPESKVMGKDMNLTINDVVNELLNGAPTNNEPTLVEQFEKRVALLA